MDSPYRHAECKQELHLGLCPGCGIAACPKGTRVVAQTLLDGDGRAYRDDAVLRFRAQCRNLACPESSWTIYEPGGYPFRWYALSVVASAVSELAVVPGATLMGVAIRLKCDRHTVARWVAGVARLDDADDLTRTCAQLDPDGLPPPFLPIASSPSSHAGTHRVPRGAPRLFPLAGQVLLLLERLAQLYQRWGIPMEEGPGLVAVLRHQFLESRLVVSLTRPVPAVARRQAAPG